MKMKLNEIKLMYCMYWMLILGNAIGRGMWMGCRSLLFW